MKKKSVAAILDKYLQGAWDRIHEIEELLQIETVVHDYWLQELNETKNKARLIKMIALELGINLD